MKLQIFIGKLFTCLILIWEGMQMIDLPIKVLSNFINHHQLIWRLGEQFFIENFSEDNNPFSGEQNYKFFVITFIQGLGFLQIMLATFIFFGKTWASIIQIGIILMKSYQGIEEYCFLELIFTMGRIGSLMI
ncbi:unnamed protein product [Paramecium pentaurelia]|uniref:Uncharacterized protein n=1 Tax=Paramecium pentaurelia TaxID=43138 RepID=A0A8S1UTD7_9CILI|nr:unnamed protein product [Paramecium pentaurelia]